MATKVKGAVKGAVLFKNFESVSHRSSQVGAGLAETVLDTPRAFCQNLPLQDFGFD